MYWGHLKICYTQGIKGSWGGAGAFPSCHRPKGRIHPGQVASPSQGSPVSLKLLKFYKTLKSRCYQGTPLQRLPRYTWKFSVILLFQFQITFSLMSSFITYYIEYLGFHKIFKSSF
ncbi:hypothetical protein MHYP_G00153110 [Metynnis hypsauchen]